jgi:hypothetical protein
VARPTPVAASHGLRYCGRNDNKLGWRDSLRKRHKRAEAVPREEIMKTRIASAAAFLSVALLLGACVTPYKEPESGPRAKVRLALLNQKLVGVTRVIGYAGTPCSDGKLIAQLELLGKKDTKNKSLDMPLNPVSRFGQSAYTEVYIPAGNRYSVAMNWNDRGYPTYKYCNVTVSFEPEADHMYEVLDLIGKGKCGILVFDIVKDQTGKFVKKRNASQKREHKCGG